jgi:hypothetical protein
MRNFLRLGIGIEVMPLLHGLARQPELWGEHRWRTTYANTPHGEVEDIWLRYSAPSLTADPKELGGVQNDSGPVWYPAMSRLPQAKPLILNLMRAVEAYELGRVVITKLAPGCRILPHADVDGDYVNDPSRARYHIVLQGLPGSLFRCGDETVCMQTGEVWLFDALTEHEVYNNSTEDRIHLIVDCRLMLPIVPPIDMLSQGPDPAPEISAQGTKELLAAGVAGIADKYQDLRA